MLKKPFRLIVLAAALLFAAFVAVWVYVSDEGDPFYKSGEMYFAAFDNDDIIVEFAANDKLIIYTMRDLLPDNTYRRFTKTEYGCEGVWHKKLFDVLVFPEARISSVTTAKKGHESVTLHIRCIYSVGFDSDFNELDMSSVTGTYGKMIVEFYGDTMVFSGGLYEKIEKPPPHTELTVAILNGDSDLPLIK
ncbi:MAG: hypothetical protein FWG32_06340 [Oscillospiraceae bacterium]|nr:hypothetical protein [Oscillospiraceae bacterium]